MGSDTDKLLDDISQIDFDNGYKKGINDERKRIKEIITQYGKYNILNTHCAEIINKIEPQPTTNKGGKDGRCKGNKADVTTFSEKELINFGNYLLSQEREERISEENKRVVTHADLANWRDSR